MSKQDEKIQITKNIINAAKQYKKFLLGKTFMYCFEDKYIEVSFRKSDFAHLTGVDKKISAKDFSAKLGVVPTTLYWYENGGTLTESHIKDICQAFNVDKEYFKGTMTLEDAGDYSGYNHQRVERIRDMMNERGIKTNKELSLLSGISTTRLSDIMAEKNKLTEDKARKIADALEVGVDWILYGDQEKKYFPVNGKMIEWLKTHPEERERIWEKMK